MARQISISKTSGVEVTDYSEFAEEFAQAYDALSQLTVNHQIDVDFPAEDYVVVPGGKNRTAAEAATEAAKEARRYVRAGKAWAAAQEHTRENGTKTPLTFARKGNVKGNPTRVSYRIYVPQEGETAAPETPSE